MLILERSFALNRLLPLAALALLSGCGGRLGEFNEGGGINATRSTCPAVAIPAATGDITLFDPPASRDARAIDVTAYKQLVESERAARRQAEEANSAKSQFLATMSHELRTPLNAISGYTQLLSLGLRGPITPEQQEDLDRIDRSQRHLLSLINDILNFAKIEAGHIAVENSPIDVSRVLESLKAFVEPQLREKSLNFSVLNTCPGVVARGDEDKVRQILINLLSNAIKFTPENGHITVDCAANDGTMDIDVRDDGAGIPKDKLDAIFEPFVQVGRDFSSPQGGTGLGLSISRDLARRMGGDLEVKSELGKGSTFRLSLRKDKSPG